MRLCGPLLGIVLVALGCAQTGATDTSSATPGPRSGEKRTVTGRLPGGEAVTVTIEDGLIADVGPEAPEAFADAPRVEYPDGYLVPGFIDSHVHLAYIGADASLVEGGVMAAVDLAAPLPGPQDIAGLEVAFSGPMLAAAGGYPTQSWGRNGYGIECASADEVRSAVAEVYAAGARVLKLSIGQGPDLTDAQLVAAVNEAHGLGMKVAVHALTDAAALKAADVGADVLAHTPVGALSEETVAAWADGTVVSTLSAFGGSSTTVDNLRRLHTAGTRVLYGTDLGNTREAAIQAAELSLLIDAGLSPAEVLDAATTAPRAFWALSSGALEVGARASILVLNRDPLDDVTAATDIRSVLIGGVATER